MIKPRCSLIEAIFSADRTSCYVQTIISGFSRFGLCEGNGGMLQDSTVAPLNLA